MNSPAKGAKYVAALVVGVVSAGAFAGVSHDGRGGDPPANPEPIVEVPSPPVESTQPALPATPDPAPTRAAVRSRGS
ncbi:MAG TPA: hypothetical protein VM282_17470 [Acidimicrobiales bacterium]|nr:hypothetical protein [Acidimicrobiales bacterium]